MKKDLLIIIGLLVGLNLQVAAQNLVPNPSFESYSACPTAAQQWARVNTWTNPTNSTPDYFHTCGSGIVTVPTNWCGYQVPRTGNAYGRCLDYGYSANYGEYIQVQLISPLVAGETYDIEYYVSLCDNQRIGHTGPEMYISVAPITSGTTSRLPYTPQIKHGSVITDKINWTRISGSYVASGGEYYITIGLFTPDASLAWTNTGVGSWTSASYYIEDVSVVLSSVLASPRLSFTGNQVDDDKIQLEWSVADPSSVSVVVIEKSSDELNFSELNYFPYSENQKMQDAHPFIGHNYYRLKTFNSDGSVSYSEVLDILFAPNQSISIYPNPVSDHQFHMNIQNIESGDVSVSLIDLQGKEVFVNPYELHDGNSSLNIQLETDLKPGLYFVSIKKGGELLCMQKIVLD